MQYPSIQTWGDTIADCQAQIEYSFISPNNPCKLPLQVPQVINTNNMQIPMIPSRREKYLHQYSLYWYHGKLIKQI